MFVDIDDLRADLARLCKKAKEEFVGEKNSDKTLLYGMLAGYAEVERMLDEQEEVYRNQGLEHIRSMMEEQNEE